MTLQNVLYTVFACFCKKNWYSNNEKLYIFKDYEKSLSTVSGIQKMLNNNSYYSILREGLQKNKGK